MAQPPAYNREKDFADDFGSETDHSALNAELDRASNSINDIRFNLAIVQADDGKLRPSVVTSDSLSDELKEYVIEEATKGAAGYAQVASSSAESALASKVAAAVSEANALVSKNAAKASELAASALQLAASNSESSALSSKNNASSSATSAAASAQAAETSKNAAVALYGDLDAVKDAANSSAASASAASNSATNAAQSAASALASKTGASSSENNAAKSAIAASASAASVSVDQIKLSQAVSSATSSATSAAASAAAASKSAEQAAAGQVNADWNAESGKGQILNKPTTLGGYGIVDAASLNVLAEGLSGKSDTDHSHTADQVSGLSTLAMSGSFGDLINKPTTLDGYGITDAAPLAHSHATADVIGLQSALDAAIASIPAGVPSGFIGMWSGSGAIPDGWALCNGENGTPDLRDKFVVGAGGSYSVGATGGNSSELASLVGSTGETTLSVSQMPSHNHGWNTPSGYTVPYFYRSSISSGIYGSGGSGGTITLSIANTGGSGSHSHSISGTATVNTLPPYFALCFIMKL